MTTTYEQIARDWNLWCEAVNPSGAMTREEFDAMTIPERVAFIVGCFGEQQTEESE